MTDVELARWVAARLADAERGEAVPVALCARAGAAAHELWVREVVGAEALRTATLARGWSQGAAPPQPCDDGDWCAWRFAWGAVFRSGIDRVELDDTGVRVFRRGEELVALGLHGLALATVRVDVPTGRGARTGRAVYAGPPREVRVVLKGSCLDVHGPVEVSRARPEVRVRLGDVLRAEW